MLKTDVYCIFIMFTILHETPHHQKEAILTKAAHLEGSGEVRISIAVNIYKYLNK
jgi:hypothetical protein